MSLSTMVRVKRLCSSLCSSPPVSMETDTDLHLSLDLFSGTVATERAGRGEERVTEGGMRGEERERERERRRIVSVTSVYRLRSV